MSGAGEEARLRELVERWARAVRAHDMAGVLAAHAADLRMFDVPMPLQSRGLDAYRAGWELFFRHNPAGPGSFDVTQLEIVAGDTAAYGHAIVTVFGREVRLTLGFVRRDGHWLVAHEHHSYPIAL